MGVAENRSPAQNVRVFDNGGLGGVFAADATLQLAQVVLSAEFVPFFFPVSLFYGEVYLTPALWDRATR
jgi:hypothetical protein